VLRQIFGFVFGIPGTAGQHENAFVRLKGTDGTDAAVERLRNAVQHNTEKAGALLAGEGLFIVADTFALDHGWPKVPVLISLLCLVVGAFLVMSILRSTMRMYRHDQENFDPLRAIYDLLLSRMIRFNCALYLTFLSILLLGVAALRFV
jgi:hypothetical protein